jgi:outer membrane protein
MKTKLPSLAAAATAVATLLGAGSAAAQSNVVQIGITDYTTHERTNGITGIGVPPGADASIGNATTVIFTYERLINPNMGIELVMGIPPTIKAKAAGSVAFLGDDILSAKNVAPTLFFNYHLGQPGDRWRPFAGIGVNYTKFASAKSRLATDVKMGDSTGWAVHAGTDYNLSKEWALWASVSALKVKSKIVATGATVLQTTVDFRPIVYSAGVAYRF